MPSRNTPKSISAVTITTALILIAAMMLTSACAFKTDDGSSKTVPPAQSTVDQQMDANRPLVKEDFKAEFIPGTELNQYTARISWPMGRTLHVKHLVDGQVVRTYDARTQNFFDVTCVAGVAKFAVQVSSPQTGTVADLENKVNCPTDLLIEQGFANLEILKLVTGRLVLANGSTIGIGSSPLELNITELIIRDPKSGSPAAATILVFDKELNTRQKDHHILVPPQIKIRAKRASGTLVFALNGVNGREKIEGKPMFNPALKGSRGADGVLGQKCIEGTGKGIDGQKPVFCKDTCETPPTDGGKGLPAVTRDANGVEKRMVGATGEDGERGIGTSPVTLDIADTSGFYVKAVMNPGRASLPQKGPLPKGGIGGDPGNNANGHCRSANPGKPGDDGIQGSAGAPALNGACGILTVSPSLIGKIKIEYPKESLGCGSEDNLVQAL